MEQDKKHKYKGWISEEAELTYNQYWIFWGTLTYTTNIEFNLNLTYKLIISEHSPSPTFLPSPHQIQPRFTITVKPKGGTISTRNMLNRCRKKTTRNQKTGLNLIRENHDNFGDLIFDV